MNDKKMMAAIAALPDAEILRAGKITDPIGSNSFYSARTVVELLERTVVALLEQERKACAQVCRDKKPCG